MISLTVRKGAHDAPDGKAIMCELREKEWEKGIWYELGRSDCRVQIEPMSAEATNSEPMLIKVADEGDLLNGVAPCSLSFRTMPHVGDGLQTQVLQCLHNYLWQI